MSQYTLTLAIGLLISLGLYDMLGIAAGGIVVPGFMAYYLVTNPVGLAATAVAGLLAYVLLTGVSKFTILYGRRRFVLALLLGLLTGVVMAKAILLLPIKTGRLSDFGYVVPGLLASWLDRQGTIVTFSALTIAVVMTHLIVMLLHAF